MTEMITVITVRPSVLCRPSIPSLLLGSGHARDVNAVTFTLTCKKRRKMSQTLSSSVQDPQQAVLTAARGISGQSFNYMGIRPTHKSRPASRRAAIPFVRALPHCHPLGVHRGRLRLRLRLPIAINPNYVTVTIVNEFLGDQESGEGEQGSLVSTCWPARHPGNTHI